MRRTVKDPGAPGYKGIMVDKGTERFYRVEVSDVVREGRECERFAWLTDADIYSDDPFHTVAVFEDRNAEMVMVEFPMNTVEVLGIV